MIESKNNIYVMKIEGGGDINPDKCYKLVYVICFVLQVELIEKDYIKEKRRSVETFEVRINHIIRVVDKMFFLPFTTRVSFTPKGGTPP